jgi:hypothetical protein
MTTRNVYTLFYIVLLALGVLSLSTSLAHAQENNIPASGEDVVVSDVVTADGVEEATTTPVVIEEATPWFKIEKLTGTVDQGDFVVGPGRAEIEVRPGQSVVLEMSITNRISDGRRFELVVEDIAGSEDGSRAVNFLGADRGPYTVKDYITFPDNYLALDLGERARIPVTISIPADAEPGGYYGGVLVSTVKDDGVDEGAGTARSPIVARIGTLFFITVPGDIVKSGKTESLSMVGDSLWYEKGPVNFSILYENTGSVHLNPYGELRIKNLFGEEVGYVELEPWFVLPKSLRSRDIAWDRELLFGRYTATALINRGYDDVIDEVSVVFWVLPWKVVGGIFLFVFLVLFGIRAFLRTFEFKRKG